MAPVAWARLGARRVMIPRFCQRGRSHSNRRFVGRRKTNNLSPWRPSLAFLGLLGIETERQVTLLLIRNRSSWRDHLELRTYGQLHGLTVHSAPIRVAWSTRKASSRSGSLMRPVTFGRTVYRICTARVALYICATASKNR